MRCTRIVATAFLLGSAGTTLGSAQTNDAPINRATEMRVAAVVAGTWAVDPGRLVLEWGHVRDGAAILPDTPFDIRGQTAGTNFTVVFSPLGRSPFAVGLRVGRRAPVPLTTRPLPAGHVVSEGDVTWGDWVLWSDDVHAVPLDGLPFGWRLRTSLAAGQPVMPPAATPPPLVAAGMDVEVVWRKRSVIVRLHGVAMHDAVAGQTVRVRLERGRGNVRGVVRASGLVELSND